MPSARKGPSHTGLDSLYTNAAENLEFLDTLVHIHVYMVTMHEYKTTMTVLIVSDYGFTHVALYKMSLT